MNIRHLRHTQINFLKWDKCISSAVNGTIFAYSWYLDVSSEGWEAIVADDYEMVMPLTINFKYNYLEISQPILCPQLGVFSAIPITETIVKNFIEAIPKKFKYINIRFNKYNPFVSVDIKNQTHSLFEMDLIRPYATLASHFKSHLKQYISEMEQQKYSVIQGVTPLQAINYLSQTKSLGNNPDFFKMKRIISFTISKNYGKILCLYDQQNTLCGIGYFVFSNYRVHALIMSVTEPADEIMGVTCILNNFIKNFSERHLTLVIEDSGSAKINDIFLSLGAQLFKYKSVQINKPGSIWNFLGIDK